MEKLEKVYKSPLPDSPYVKPFRLNYTQNGKQKSWDLLEVHDSVAIIVFNVTRKVMILVKQFRPAIYFNCIDPKDRDEEFIDTEKYPASLGIALEMCAGIVDKDKPIIEIAREEVLEECGYNVQVSNLQKVMTYRSYEPERLLNPLSYNPHPIQQTHWSGVGVQGSSQTLYYCEVTDDMKTEQGGGVDDEIIDVVEMTIPQIEKMMSSEGPLSSPPSCLFALMWFLHNKSEKFKKSFARYCGECKEDKD